MADRFWIKATAGVWDDTANWSTSSGGSGGASVPVSGDTAIFDGNGVGNCDVTAGFYTVATLDLQTGYTGKVFQTTRAFIIESSLSVSSDSTVECGGTTANGFVLNDGATATVNGQVSGSGYLRPRGTLSLSGSGTISANVLHINSGNFASDSLTIGSSLLFTGDITFDATGNSSTLTVNNSGNHNLEFRGDVTLQATGTSATIAWTKGTGTITLSGTADQDIDFDGESVEDIEIDKSAGTVTLTGNVTTDTLTLTDGTLDVDSFTLTSSGGVTGAAGFVVQDTTGGGEVVCTTIVYSGTSWTDAALSASGATRTFHDCTVTLSDASGSVGAIDATDNCTDVGGNTNYTFVADDNFPTGWSRKQAITIQNSQVSGSGTLSDFPVLITRDHLDDEVVDPSGSNASQSDGGDVRFSSDSAGATQLPCEIVSWEHDTTTGAGDAAIEAYVKVDVSGTADTTIYIWYKTTGTTVERTPSHTYGRNAVWSGHALAYHMAQDPSGSLVDSTGNTAGTTSNGTMVSGDLVAGSLGNDSAVDFDGSDDYHDTGRTLDMSAETQWSVIVWMSHKGTTGNAYSVGARSETGDDAGWAIGPYAASDDYAAKYGSNIDTRVDVGDAADINSSTQFYQYALTGSGGSPGSITVEHYFDGGNLATEQATSVGWNTAQTDRDIYIGVENNEGSPGLFRVSQIDEVQIFEGVTLSGDWITTDFNNRSSPATFATAGTPEAVGGGGGTAFPFHRYYAQTGGACV